MHEINCYFGFEQGFYRRAIDDKGMVLYMVLYCII